MNKIIFNVISLDSEFNKFSDFEQRNKSEKFLFQKFSAIDGYTLDRSTLVSTGLIAPDLSYATGALGCAMSHISLWHRCVEQNQVMNIAEDDAAFRFDLADEMSNIFNSNPDFDIIYWGYNRDVNTAFKIPGLGKCMSVFDQRGVSSHLDLDIYQRTRTPVLFVECARVFGILCYSISPKGAQKLIEACLPLRPLAKRDEWSNGLAQDHTYIFHNVGIDVLMGVFFNEILNSFLLFPPLAISLNTLGPISTTQTPF